MTDHRDDKEFDAFLAGESELVDRYTEMRREEPPPELDARILAAARSAAKVSRLKFAPRANWFRPVALAATILLSFSLVMNVVIESPTRFEQVVTESTGAAVRIESERPAGKLPAAQMPRALSDTNQGRAPEELSMAMANLPAGQVATAAKESRAQTNADDVTGLQQPAEFKRQLKRQIDPDMEREMSGQLSAGIVEEIAVTSHVQTYDELQRSAYAEKDASLSVAAVRSAERSIDRDAALLIVAEYVAARSMSPVRSRAAAPEYEKKVVSHDAKVQSAMADFAAADSGMASSDGSQADGDPESYLRDIVRLSADGNSAAASRRLDEFLARYPDHPVSIKIRQRDH